MGFNGPLFDWSAQATKGTPLSTDVEPADSANYNPLEGHRQKDKGSAIPDAELEGFDDDPTITKVVDRRWYERNKHIFPASVWVEYKLDVDLSKAQRKDTEGNAFFFS